MGDRRGGKALVGLQRMGMNTRMSSGRHLSTTTVRMCNVWVFFLFSTWISRTTCLASTAGCIAFLYYYLFVADTSLHCRSAFSMGFHCFLVMYCVLRMLYPYVLVQSGDQLAMMMPLVISVHFHVGGRVPSHCTLEGLSTAKALPSRLLSIPSATLHTAWLPFLHLSSPPRPTCVTQRTAPQGLDGRAQAHWQRVAKERLEHAWSGRPRFRPPD